MDTVFAFLAKWLPLMQGFAAMASVVGAFLSLRYALRAEKARKEMAEHLVTARLAEKLQFVANYFATFRQTAVGPEGSADPAQYRQHTQGHMLLLEEASSMAKASEAYFIKRPAGWGALRTSLETAARYPTPNNIETCCKNINDGLAQLSLAATTKAAAPSK